MDYSIHMKHYSKKQLDLILRVSLSFFFGIIFFLAVFAPIIQEVKGYPAGESIYALFRPICHQYPTRSLWIFDRPWALCTRCSFGYLGIAIASIFLKLKASYRIRALLGFLLLAVVAIDPLFQLLTLYESTNILRILTGLIGGCAVFLILYPLSWRPLS